MLLFSLRNSTFGGDFFEKSSPIIFSSQDHYLVWKLLKDLHGGSFNNLIRPASRVAALLMNEMNSYFRADPHAAIVAPSENKNGIC
jgi:hypothetical protein